MSVSVSGGQPNGVNVFPAVSADGRYITFESFASNLVPGDTNQAADVFVRDVRTGTTSRVSLTSAGGQINGSSGAPSISADGRWVAFTPSGTNVVPGAPTRAGNAFVRDQVPGTTVRVGPPTTDGSVVHPSISADGRYVAFTSFGPRVPGDTNTSPDVYLWERQTGALELVSVSSSGEVANADSYEPSLSADGRYVAFYSGASNLVSGDIGGYYDLFVRDRRTDTTTRLTASSTADSAMPRMTPDGRYVVFASAAFDLVPGDANDRMDVFVHDRATATTSLVSLSPTGGQLPEGGTEPSISADGRYVAFISHYGDFNEVLLRDRQAGTTVTASVSTGGAPSNGDSGRPSISANGRAIAFASMATSLVHGDPDPNEEIFLRDRRR
ncbi:hypothetical protein K1W54_30140 [Micromonospora sp. CPCC 205371]|nr:hypothetical protein [Micromonospora sp. CPCC 205371]